MNALKEQGVLTGIRFERQEIGQPGEFQAIEAMSRAELIAFIQNSIEAGELIWPDTPKSDSDQSVAPLGFRVPPKPIIPIFDFALSQSHQTDMHPTAARTTKPRSPRW
jgi:hypothetical protein